MIQNALITKTFLGINDHGILTAFIVACGDGWGQSFGGCNLDDKPKGKSFCGIFIRRLLETVGAERWEDLKGQAIRIDGDENGIHGIGHIIKDIWFYPQKEFEEYSNDKA